MEPREANLTAKEVKVAEKGLQCVCPWETLKENIFHLLQVVCKVICLRQGLDQMAR